MHTLSQIGSDLVLGEEPRPSWERLACRKPSRPSVSGKSLRLDAEEAGQLIAQVKLLSDRVMMHSFLCTI